MKWEDKAQVKKGNIGEKIIQQYLEGKGWKVYKPFTKGAHWFENTWQPITPTKVQPN
jgi:hypothetical protein